VFPHTVQQVKRWLKIVSGFTLLAIGIVMLVTPGPGWLTIIAGLALLAAEYVWARRLLARMKAGGTRLRNAVMPSRRSAPVVAHASPAVPAATSDLDPSLDVDFASPLDASPQAAAVKVKD
jgi:drug/metabolite transporter (DMT)-like permease